jgi:hypothetical protein
MPVGVEQHLVGLQQIGTHQEGPAVRQLDVGHLKLGPLTANDGIVLAPVELERLAGAEDQRNERAAPRGLLLALPVCPPLARKVRTETATISNNLVPAGMA